MTVHSDHTTAAILASADASTVMPYPGRHPTEAMREHRLARLWKVAGAIACLEDDPGAFGELLEACGLLPYEAAKPKLKAEHSPVITYPRPGQ
jgi:hypothetical protein